MIEIIHTMEGTRELIEKYALQNAVKYNAAPNAGAVMGKLMGEHPELRAGLKRSRPWSKMFWQRLRRPALRSGKKGWRQ